ncbi:MAG: phage portal protein, partial [Pseudomonadota bacterium]
MTKSPEPQGLWARLAAPFRENAERKASAAKPLIALTSAGAPVWTPRDYAALAREGYQKNVIAYRCIRMIAEAAAATPFCVHDEAGRAVDHPLLELLHRPNADQTGTEFLAAFYGYLQTSGNGYLELVSLEGEPRELYALRPDRMKAKIGSSGWPEAYEYSAGGSSVVFRRDAATGTSPILHMRLFHPTNDHYGMSPLEAAAASIDIHNAGSAWNKALLDNAARPSGALVYRGGAGSLTEEQFERLKAELSDAHQGAAAAGRPLLLEGGLDWKPMSLSPADMDFINAKHVSAREIALAFGVPPMLLGIPGDNTYANY